MNRGAVLPMVAVPSVVGMMAGAKIGARLLNVLKGLRHSQDGDSATAVCRFSRPAQRFGRMGLSNYDRIMMEPTADSTRAAERMRPARYASLLGLGYAALGCWSCWCWALRPTCSGLTTPLVPLDQDLPQLWNQPVAVYLQKTGTPDRDGAGSALIGKGDMLQPGWASRFWRAAPFRPC
jgi:hypothetical protein